MSIDLSHLDFTPKCSVKMLTLMRVARVEVVTQVVSSCEGGAVTVAVCAKCPSSAYLCEAHKAAIEQLDRVRCAVCSLEDVPTAAVQFYELQPAGGV